MKIIKKLGIWILAVSFCVAVGSMSANKPVLVNAQTNEEFVAVASENNEIKPMALINNMTVSIHADSSYVWAEAKNDFTFPLAKVYTQVKLYSSQTYTEDVSKMTLEAQTSIADLDTGKSIIAKKAINGRQLYWRAEMIYQTDKGPLNDKQTDTWHISANGTVIR